MQEHPNAALVRAGLEAFAAGSLEGFVGIFSDDVVWHVPGANRFSGRFDGKTAVAERAERIFAAGITPSFQVHDVVANDDHVVALVHFQVENADGARYEQPQVQVMHMRDGKVADFWIMNQDQAVLDLLLGS